LILAYILFVIASYLFGSVPFMILIGRLRGFDLSRELDLHQALWHKVGRMWGALGVLLDILKGVLPVLAGLMLQFPLYVTVLGGLAALCGQMWPVFRKFNGERGNTTGLGIVLTLTIALGVPFIVIIAVGLAAIGFIIRTINRRQMIGHSLNELTKFRGPPSMALPLGVLVGFSSCPVTSALAGQPLEVTLGFATIVVLILIRRLTAGLRQDLSSSNKPGSVIINRLLFDRSEI